MMDYRTHASKLIEARCVKLGVPIERRFSDDDIADAQRELDEADALYYERLETPDDPDPDDDGEPRICGNCDGSGEGMHDGSTCGVCRGRGEI
jgi:hypothetical protein